MSSCELKNGDCIEILPTLPMVDSIIIDPPYGTQTPEGYGYGRRQLYGGIGRTIENDSDLSLLETASPLMWNIAKENTWHGSFCAARRMNEVMKIFEQAGFVYFGEIVWDKRQAGLGYAIRYQHESILIFKKGEPVKADDAILSVISCHTVKADTAKHPHAKPVPVMKRLVSWLCPEGGTVLDFTCGIGSTGIACKETGRNFIGIEKSKEYFDIAQARIGSAQVSLFHAGLTPANNRLHLDVGDSPAQQALFTPEADSAEGKLPAPAPRR